MVYYSSTRTDFPVFDEFCKDSEEIGGICCLWVLGEHEAELPVGILHLGIRNVQLLNLLLGLSIKAVKRWSQGGSNLKSFL